MRRPDWKSRLSAHVAAAARMPYAIGEHDCALFAAGAVQAVRGDDPAAIFRGRYDTKFAGLRLLADEGVEGLIAAVEAVLDEIAPAFAAAGDIAVLDDADTGQQVLGVVQGEQVYVLRPDGLGLMPREAMVRAFRT